MVQLRWLWTNTLCLVIMSGLLSVQSLQLHHPLSVVQLSSAPQRAFFVPVEITNRVFTAALLNPASEEYQAMYKEVSHLLESIYGCSKTTICPTHCFYGGVVAMTFRSGSVIANSTVVFNIFSINPSIVYLHFHNNANNPEPRTLLLNLDYTTINKIIETAVPKATTTTTTTATTTTTTVSATTTPPTTTTPTMTTTTSTKPTTTTTTPTMTTTTTPTTSTTTTITTTTYPITTTPTSTTATTTTTTPTITTTTPTMTTAPTTSTTTFTTTTIATTTTTTTTMNNTITVNPHTKTDSLRVAAGKQASGGGSSSDWVPGWGTSLLVLAAAILLLLIVISIILMVQWCKKTESVNMDTTEDPYYTEKKQLLQDPLPLYSPQTPGPTTVIIGSMPMRNGTGFCAVNP